MAKFTVYFKDKAIQSQFFDSGIIHIGRDESNDLAIDNPTVAPAHAVVIVKDNNYLIKQLNNEFPLIINNEKSKEALLENNDIITIGKHTVLFSSSESINSIQNNTINKTDIDLLNEKIIEKVHIPDATLQVLDGQHIGRMLPLKKAMTRFGQSGSVIVIAKRKEGYFISSLEGGDNITINRQPLADKTINLNNNDIVIIDNTSMQFFLEG
jgi:phosphoribosylaminoimidazole carboxylase (NCAIR synthetase)